MVSFVCDNCGDTLTKPKVKNHLMRPRCSRSSFSCIDCYTRFSHDTVHQHTQCITEAQKHHGQYAETKNRAGNDKPKNTNNNNSSPSTKNEKKQEEKKPEQKKEEEKDLKRKATEETTTESTTKTNDTSKDTKSSEEPKSKKQKVENSESTTVTPLNNETITINGISYHDRITTIIKEKKEKKVELSVIKEQLVNDCLKEIKLIIEKDFEESVKKDNKLKRKKGKVSIRKNPKS